jgi:isoleucyl-tRNA synthetase
LAQRAASGIKVRQPLRFVEVPELASELAGIVAEELNVKEVRVGDEIKLNTEITPELKSEGTARELVRIIQNARKNAGFNVEDRILSKITSEAADILDAFTGFKEIVDAETLAVGRLEEEGEYSETAKIEGQQVQINLKRAS